MEETVMKHNSRRVRNENPAWVSFWQLDRIRSEAAETDCGQNPTL
jgi:hypothetical protein